MDALRLLAACAQGPLPEVHGSTGRTAAALASLHAHVLTRQASSIIIPKLPPTTALPFQQHPAQALSMLQQQQQAGFPDSTAHALAGLRLSAPPLAGAFSQALGGQQLLPTWQWPLTPHPAMQQQLLPTFPPAVPQPSMFMSWPGHGHSHSHSHCNSTGGRWRHPRLSSWGTHARLLLFCC